MLGIVLVLQVRTNSQEFPGKYGPKAKPGPHMRGIVVVMSEYKVREVAQILAVSDDTVRRWIDDGSLVASRDGGRIHVDGKSVAELAIRLAEGKADTDHGVSTRNELAGIVTRVQVDGVMAQVDLQCGIYRVVSLISAEAVREMGLEVGSPATALIKATNVSVKSGILP